VVDLLEVVLLELAESGAAVEAGVSRKRAQGRPNIEHRRAEVIPIDRARLSPRRAPRRRVPRGRRTESAGLEPDIQAAAAPPPEGRSDPAQKIDD
jgi:hypothetical protein